MPDRPEINEDFADMLLCLQRASVEFVLVGAHALAAHGIARATGDIDIFVRPSPENAVRVVQALVDFGAPIALHRSREMTRVCSLKMTHPCCWDRTC